MIAIPMRQNRTVRRAYENAESSRHERSGIPFTQGRRHWTSIADLAEGKFIRLFGENGTFTGAESQTVRSGIGIPFVKMKRSPRPQSRVDPGHSAAYDYEYLQKHSARARIG